MINIVCLKWGDKYSPDYVNRLYNMVERNCTIPHDFYCFTENSEGLNGKIKIIQFRAMLNGWWNKIFLFDKANLLTGTCFYFDLDTVIIRNIDDMLIFGNSDCIYGLDDALFNEIGSGILRWEAGKHDYLFDNFGTDVINHTWGDQNWINLCAGLHGLQTGKKDSKHTMNLRVRYPQLIPKENKLFPFPREWAISYKVHYNIRKYFTNQTKIIYFHGIPHPHEVLDDSIIKENWR